MGFLMAVTLISLFLILLIIPMFRIVFKKSEILDEEVKNEIIDIVSGEVNVIGEAVIDENGEVVVDNFEIEDYFENDDTMDVDEGGFCRGATSVMSGETNLDSSSFENNETIDSESQELKYDGDYSDDSIFGNDDSNYSDDDD